MLKLIYDKFDDEFETTPQKICIVVGVLLLIVAMIMMLVSGPIPAFDLPFFALPTAIAALAAISYLFHTVRGTKLYTYNISRDCLGTVRSKLLHIIIVNVVSALILGFKYTPHDEYKIKMTSELIVFFVGLMLVALTSYLR